MKRKSSSGQYAGKDAGSADLERGFIADGSDIPDDGENVFHPESGKRKAEMAKWMHDDEPGFDGGFLGRDACGHERY